MLADMTGKGQVGAPRSAIDFHEDVSAAWAGGYAKRGFRSRLELHQSILGDATRSGEKWLDLGCGAGVLTRELLMRSCDVVALDGSKGMLSQAKVHCGETAGRVEWHLGDAQDLSFIANGSLDGVLCSSVIEYLPEAETIFSEISRVTRAGGALIVSIPPRGGMVRTLQKAHRLIWRLWGRDRHPYLAVSKLEISPTDVARILERHGFQLQQAARFDAVLPRWLLVVTRPSLIIYSAVKVGSSMEST